MPRFYFHVTGHAPDDEGLELESLAVAKCEAVETTGRIICDTASTFWDTKELQMTVMNASGLILFVLNFIGTEAPIAQAAHS